MAAGSLPAGDESVRFNGTEELARPLPEDKANWDCARRLCPNSNGRDNTMRVARAEFSMISDPVVLVLKFTHRAGSGSVPIR